MRLEECKEALVDIRTLAGGGRIVDSIVVHLVHSVNLVYSGLATTDADSSAGRCLLCGDIEQIGDQEGCAVEIWRR
jgi:hypothetical protein